MGVNRQDVGLLLRLRRQGYLPDQARVVELGAQQLSHDVLADRDLVKEFGKSFGQSDEPPLPQAEGEAKFNGIEQVLDPNAPMARLMWLWLGLGYTAIDIDGSPDSIPLDLNFDDVPQSERSKYHLVTNYGTTEHVANQMNALKIAHDLATPDGVMVHHLPCQGNFNHGLLNYSPKFFWMLARSNDYGWLYFDHVNSEISYPLPENVIESVRPYRTDIDERMAQYRVSNTSLVVALQKRWDRPFVPPIDVPNGTITSDQNLLERYPTVFKRSN
jgi:hypothetical protein